MLALAVVGAVSCEKELPSEATPEEEKSTTSNESQKESSEKMAEMAKFVGYWLRSVDLSVEQNNPEYEEFAWHFFEDGSGYQTIDFYSYESYLDEMVIGGINHVPFTYDIVDGLLHITYAQTTEPIIWHYEFGGDTLSVYSEMDELGLTYIYTKTKCGDTRFLGDWSNDEVAADGSRIDRHIVFDTPLDGHFYEVHYKNANTASGDIRHGATFKYTFDSEKITINKIDCGACGSSGTITYYYRLEGTRIYLKSSADDKEVCYLNFKKEHNL